jgi:MFS family permease
MAHDIDIISLWPRQSTITRPTGGCLAIKTIDTARLAIVDGVGVDEPTSAPTRDTLWSAVLLLAAILLAAGMLKTVFSPLQEAAKLDMSLSDFAISLVQGLATGAPIALISIPLAWVIDHGHRVRLLTALLATCVVGTLWTGFATGLPSLFLARMLSATGASCSVPVAISLVADLCAPDKRGRAIVVLGLGVAAGSAAAFALGGWLLTVLAAHPLAALAGMASWRATHLVLGVAGALLLFPLFILREPARHEVELRTADVRTTVRSLWAKRGFLVPLFAGQIGVSMADTAAGIWATPVLIRSYHLQPGQFAGWVGVILLVSGVLGSVLGGLGADFGHKNGRRGGILIAAVIATVLSAPTGLFPVMPTIAGFQLMFFLLLLSGTTTSIVASTTIAVLIPNEERGACMAVFSVISAIVGVSLAPTIVTFGASVMGGEQHLAPALATTGVVTSVISLVGYILAMRRAPNSATDWG